MSTIEITRMEDVQVGDLVTLEDRRDPSDDGTFEPDPDWRLTGHVRAIDVTTTDNDGRPYGWGVQIGHTPYPVGYRSPGGEMWAYSLVSATREVPEYEPGAVYEVTPRQLQAVKPFLAWYCGSAQYGYFIDAEGDKWRPHDLTGIRRLKWVGLIEPAPEERVEHGEDEAAEKILAAHDREVAAQALREAADYQGPADEAAHFTPEARNLLRSLAERSEATAEGPGSGVYGKPEPKVIGVKNEENA